MSSFITEPLHVHITVNSVQGYDKRFSLKMQTSTISGRDQAVTMSSLHQGVGVSDWLK